MLCASNVHVPELHHRADCKADRIDHHFRSLVLHHIPHSGYFWPVRITHTHTHTHTHARTHMHKSLPVCTAWLVGPVSQVHVSNDILHRGCDGLVWNTTEVTVNGQHLSGCQLVQQSIKLRAVANNLLNLDKSSMQKRKQKTNPQ